MGVFKKIWCNIKMCFGCKKHQIINISFVKNNSEFEQNSEDNKEDGDEAPEMVSFEEHDYEDEAPEMELVDDTTDVVSENCF